MPTGMQSISQLRNIYGNHAAETISNLCNTRIFFRAPSFETAQWASRELGENETEEIKENISRVKLAISNLRVGVNEGLLINTPNALESAYIKRILRTKITRVSCLDFTTGYIIVIFAL